MIRIVGVPSRDTFGGMTSCDLTGNVGDRILLFMDDRGDALLCGGSARLDEPGPPGAEEKVAMLRDYRDGRAPDLAHPWRFRDSGRACVVQHGFDAFSIAFSYVYDGPQLVVEQGERIGEPRLTMSLVHPMYDIDVTSIRIDASDVQLTRLRREVTSLVGRETRTLVSDVAVGDQAEELFNRMLKPVDVVVSGSGPGEFRASTRTTRLRDVSELFDACIKKHSKSYCFNPSPGNEIEQPFCVPVDRE